MYVLCIYAVAKVGQNTLEQRSGFSCFVYISVPAVKVAFIFRMIAFHHIPSDYFENMHCARFII